jgi:hypothetical protein
MFDLIYLVIALVFIFTAVSIYAAAMSILAIPLAYTSMKYKQITKVGVINYKQAFTNNFILLLYTFGAYISGYIWNAKLAMSGSNTYSIETTIYTVSTTIIPIAYLASNYFILKKLHNKITIKNYLINVFNPITIAFIILVIVVMKPLFIH